VNTGKERAKVSLLFTWAVRFYFPEMLSSLVTKICLGRGYRDWAIEKITIDINLLQNSIGGSSHLSGDHVNEPFQ